MEDISDIICKDAGSELVLLAALVSMSIGHNLSSFEQNLFGNFLQVVGENLCVMSIRKAKCKTDLKNLKTEEMNTEIKQNITNETLRNNKK